MKKLLAVLLAALMLVGVFAACSKKTNTESPSAPTSDNPSGDPTDGTPAPSEPAGPQVETFPEGEYVYKDSVSTLATNWNPHTYQTQDDSYPASFIRVGLYDIIFNDALHPVEGREAYEGYLFIPEMAAEMPIDVTETVRAEHPEYNIPDSATAGYAYIINLNKNAVWENGTPINADTYIYSMRQLLNPELLNYRATDYYAGDLCIAGAEFYANQGQTNQLTVRQVMEKEGLEDLEAYWAAYGDKTAYINWDYSFSAIYSKEAEAWSEEGFEDALVETEFTSREAYDLYIDMVVNHWQYDEATATEFYMDESYVDWTYPEGVDFSTVGIYKNDEYSITLVFGKSLAGFNLLYNLSSNWIVYEELYESCLKKNEGVWTTTYNTSVETTMSYGPYKLTGYQADKQMTFERNEAWYGYTDGQHIYQDPNGKVYPMYQTTKIDCGVVSEAATRKTMFLKGQLMSYGLQAEDFDEYRSSEYCYATPSETIFFFIVNGYESAINSREENPGFDTTKYDLQTLTLTSFRKALAVTYDKDAMASTISPQRSGGYGIIGSAYIYDPDTGARYRDTDQAKNVLCQFYGVDVSQFEDLDAAVNSITGYDPVQAKALYTEAFNEALEKGYITDDNEDGISDQTVQIEYCMSADSDFMTKTIDYLNNKMTEVIAGTPFEGKITFVKSAAYGTEWSQKIKSGMSDIVLGGWSGSALNPFGLSDLYVNPNYQYDAQWFTSTSVDMTLTINGEELTTNIKAWSDALNGATITINGKDYCFGDGIADVETRLDILAGLELKILETYDYIPMLQDGSMSLLSQQVYYVIDEYNPILGRGGIAYMKYNYNEADWNAYVASQPDGNLKY